MDKDKWQILNCTRCGAKVQAGKEAKAITCWKCVLNSVGQEKDNEKVKEETLARVKARTVPHAKKRAAKKQT